MTEPLLRVRFLSKRHGALWALRDVSFNLAPGEIIGLVGRRGAGKTSLLNVIGAGFPPSEGEFYFQGQRCVNLSPVKARRMGIELIQQTPRLTEQQDIIENIFLGREICWPPKLGLPDRDGMYRRAVELLATFDYPSNLLQMRTSNLNDEQRQVVAISRSLCFPPQLLLVDDILESLTFQRQQILLDQLKKLSEGGTGVIISSDNLKHLFNLTNRILVLYEGRLTADRYTSECTPRDIVELIVGTSSREQVTPVIWALESFHAAQLQTEELYRAQAALHQSLEASDSLNRQLVKRLSEQVKALDRLNTALQETQRRLLTESEEERKALARDLHDQVIQDLLSINYRLEDVEDDNIPVSNRNELNAIRNRIRQVVGDLRQVCRDLRPPTIDNHGLSSAIRSLAQEWSERTGVYIQLQIDPELGRLPEAIEISIFRIVQEGINNVAKHASAKWVELTLKRTSLDNLLLRIADDGKGVPTIPNLANLSVNKHFGLVGISERAALLGGSMQIESPREGGLILQVEIPSPYPSE